MRILRIHHCEYFDFFWVHQFDAFPYKVVLINYRGILSQPFELVAEILHQRTGDPRGKKNDALGINQSFEHRLIAVVCKCFFQRIQICLFRMDDLVNVIKAGQILLLRCHWRRVAHKGPHRMLKAAVAAAAKRIAKARNASLTDANLRRQFICCHKKNIAHILVDIVGKSSKNRRRGSNLSHLCFQRLQIVKVRRKIR